MLAQERLGKKIHPFYTGVPLLFIRESDNTMEDLTKLKLIYSCLSEPAIANTKVCQRFGWFELVPQHDLQCHFNHFLTCPPSPLPPLLATLASMVIDGLNVHWSHSFHGWLISSLLDWCSSALRQARPMTAFLMGYLRGGWWLALYRWCPHLMAQPINAKEKLGKLRNNSRYWHRLCA